MNKSQTTRVNKAEGSIAEAISELTEVRDELQEAYDEKGEKWQEGDKGEAAMAEIDELTSCIESLENAQAEIPTEVV